MTVFPDSPWKPGPEYFSARAPDGSPLHGSSKLKRYLASPRLFGEEVEARRALDAQRLWDFAKAGALAHLVKRYGGQARVDAAGSAALDLSRPHVSPRHLRTLERLKPKPFMLFGTGVEYFALPTPGEPKPDMPKAKLLEAEWRADDIRQHKEAGQWLSAPGAVHQVAHMWKDAGSGLWCRGKFDSCCWARGTPRVLDLKVWSGVNARNVKWKVYDWGAVLQAALYRRLAIDLWNERPPHMLIIADPREDGKIFVRTISKAMIEAEDDKLSRTLDRLAKCYQSGDFTDPEEGNQEIK